MAPIVPLRPGEGRVFWTLKDLERTICQLVVVVQSSLVLVDVQDTILLSDSVDESLVAPAS